MPPNTCLYNMADAVVIQLPRLVGRQAESWKALIEIAPTLGKHWILVGGQMVFLHEVERRATNIRPTDDIDVVVDLRVEPTGLDRIHQVLTSADFVQDWPSPEGLAHRYRRSGAAIDVLAPDHIGKRATLLLGAGRTIEAPGTTQAFARSSVVQVELASGGSALIRRPTLIGALLGKVAAVTEIVSMSAAERAKHLRDVDVLARLIGPDDRDGVALSRSERSALAGIVVATELSPLAASSIRLLIT